MPVASLLSVTPCVGVWIETRFVNINSDLSASHPAWVCGLKLTANTGDQPNNRSHPAWVCGLKQRDWQEKMWGMKSHPAWVCGLKQKLGFYETLHFCHTLRGCVD